MTSVLLTRVTLKASSSLIPLPRAFSHGANVIVRCEQEKASLVKHRERVPFGVVPLVLDPMDLG